MMENKLIKKIRKLAIALIGVSKGGKTSFINSLSHNPKQMLRLHADEGARTKVTVNYEFVPYEGNEEAKVTQIKWHKARIACGSDFKNFDSYNKAVDDNKTYQTIGLRRIDECKSLNDELENQLKQIVENISIEKAIEFINTEGIDEYISTITIQIPANDYLSKVLSEHNMVLVLKDMRGLMDFRVKDGKNNEKNISIKPLADLGLDGINGIIFMCEGQFQESIAAIYEDMLETVMNAVPIFLVSCDKTIKKDYINKVQEAKDVIDREKKDEIEFISNFYEALNFLRKIRIVEKNNGKYKFTKFNYFDDSDVEYLLPECKYLKMCEMEYIVKENPLEDESYVSYLNYTTYIIKDIIEKLLDYYDKISRIFKDNMLADVLRKHKKEFQQIVTEDFRWFDCAGSTQYARPQVGYESTESISNKMCDSNVEILGPQDGITSKRGNRYIYIASGVAGVTIERALRDWINRQAFYSEINLVSELNDDIKIKVIKKALTYVLQKRFLDYYATFQGYLCMNRYVIRDNILAIRDKNVHESMAMYEYAGFVLEAFCRELEGLVNEEVWDLITECGKNPEIKH